MLEIAGNIFKIGTMLLGDALMSKWTAAFQFWYRQYAEAEMKKKVDDEYERLQRYWDYFQKDRE